MSPKLSPHAAIEALKMQLGAERPCIVVFDLEKYGYVVPHIECQFTIVIAPGFSVLEKLFVLAHEMGHIYTYPRGYRFGRLVRRNQGERHANEYAIRVCSDLLGRDVRKEYAGFYARFGRL